MLFAWWNDSGGILCDSVGKATDGYGVYEMRRQFKEIPGLWKGRVNQNIMVNVAKFQQKPLCAEMFNDWFSMQLWGC
jgi:Na+/H+-translocating membrane pyrophosphatase